MSDSGRTPSRRTVRDSAKLSHSVTRASERIGTRTGELASADSAGRARSSLDFDDFDGFGEFAELTESDGSVRTGTARAGANASRKSTPFGDFETSDEAADERPRTRTSSFDEFGTFDAAPDDAVRAKRRPLRRNGAASAPAASSSA